MCFCKRRKKYRCICCGKKTLSEKPPGTHEICPVCGWEDDAVQAADEDFAGGANALSLREYRLQYEEKKRLS